MAYTTIDDPSAYFQTKLYTGGTAEAKTFDGNSNLKPDWFWSKKRGAVQFHATADSSRGIANALRIDTTGAEYTNTEADDLASFDTNGFTFDDTGDTYNGTYESSSYVAWCWKANGGTTASNSNGTITSTVQANTTAGFSIVTYTGNGSSSATIGHGLGAVPSMFIIKRRSGTEDWVVYHHKNTSAPETDHLLLNTTDATSDSDTRFNDTAPTSTLITIGSNAVVNASSSTYVCYAFAEKQGYSKFGSYTGNGAQNGTFVYTGFKPAWIMIKRTDAVKNWYIADTTRSPNNIIKAWLKPHSSDAENDSGDVTDVYFDILSNGFKLRQDFSHLNASGGTHVYMAFAESPFVSSEGVPTTAR